MYHPACQDDCDFNIDVSTLKLIIRREGTLITVDSMYQKLSSTIVDCITMQLFIQLQNTDYPL